MWQHGADVGDRGRRGQGRYHRQAHRALASCRHALANRHPLNRASSLCRDGENTKSNQLDDRLSTGALVEEVELKGDRLHYKLVLGTGPPDGWATWPSTSFTGCLLRSLENVGSI